MGTASLRCKAHVAKRRAFKSTIPQGILLVAVEVVETDRQQPNSPSCQPNTAASGRLLSPELAGREKSAAALKIQHNFTTSAFFFKSEARPVSSRRRFPLVIRDLNVSPHPRSSTLRPLGSPSLAPSGSGSLSLVRSSLRCRFRHIRAAWLVDRAALRPQDMVDRCTRRAALPP